MLELVAIIVASIAVGKGAEMDDRSPLVWGGICFALAIIISMFMPAPYIGAALGAIATFLIMFAINLTQRKV
jgi:hypothetical protein